MTEPAERPKALAPGVFPPEVADLDGFRLRRATPDDDVALHEAIKSSFAELHPWMPWCTNPVELADQRDFIARSAEQWTSQTSFNWLVIGPGDTVIGSISIMDRIGPATLEIGYWLLTDTTGRGIMTRAAAWATDTALALPGIDHVEIHCDATNVRSAAVPQRLGYRLERTESVEPTAPGESGLKQVWVTS